MVLGVVVWALLADVPGSEMHAVTVGVGVGLGVAVLVALVYEGPESWIVWVGGLVGL